MPLRANHAKAYIRRILSSNGLVVVSDHAREELGKDDVLDPEMRAVLRGGVTNEAEWEKGEWRHHVETPNVTLIVTFDPYPEMLPPETADISAVELVVVTGWRQKHGSRR